MASVITMPKVFIIGFNKTGTRTLHHFFKENNIPSIHYDTGNLVETFENNIKNGNRLLAFGKTTIGLKKGIRRLWRRRPVNWPLRLDFWATGISSLLNQRLNYEDATVFSDMTKCTDNKDAKDYYKLLDIQYPGSKFILNIRDVDNWILSRMNHGKGKLLKRHLNYHNCDKDEIISIWKQIYFTHIKEVKNYFKNRNSDLLIFDIEKDNVDKIIDFLKPYYKLDKEKYVIRGVTKQPKQ